LKRLAIRREATVSMFFVASAIAGLAFYGIETFTAIETEKKKWEDRDGGEE
jgi:hypothetical protein